MSQTHHHIISPEVESLHQEDYPDEVLEAEWNPILAEIRSIRLHSKEATEPTFEAGDTLSL